MNKISNGISGSPIFKHTRWFIIFWVIFFPFLFPGLPRSERCRERVAGCHFLAPLRYWMLWKCWRFSRNLLHLVSLLLAVCASSSRITGNTIPEPEESSQYIRTAQPYSEVQAGSRSTRLQSGLNCNIVKTEREAGWLRILWGQEILWRREARDQSRGCGKFHYFI